ncbi:MAG: phospholipase D-like domain-containing protein, partial [Pseudobdellovibrio sp.]
ARAKDYFRYFKSINQAGIETYDQQFAKCFAPVLNFKYTAEYNYSPFQMVASCINSTFPKVLATLPSQTKMNIPFFAVNLANNFINHPGHAISTTGWLQGNNLNYFTYNDVSQNLVEKMASVKYILTQNFNFKSQGSLQSFQNADLLNTFTDKNGIPTVYNHPVWSQKNTFFSDLIQSIDKAQESMFMDMFFLGGTTGASLAHHLLLKIQKNPNFKIFFLRDNINHFGYENEMRPVFNFLLATSLKYPKNIIILESYIEGRKSGLPFVLQETVTDGLLFNTGIQNHLSLYGRAQSDHSKVIVIDGMNTETAVAYVGSKNLTDSSGAVCYDDVVKIQGPAAHVVLDDYYDDMKAALINKADKYSPQYLMYIFKNGWANGDITLGTTVEAMATTILKPFDLLNRDIKGYAQNKSFIVPIKGSTVLRTGLNNVDSSRTNIIDQVIQSILFAQKKILIKEQFLFERRIINALIKVKNNNPNLDIRIILEPIPLAKPQGFPNLLYLSELAKYKIQVKFKKTVVNSQISQDYHFKTLSVDGKFLISGSANKDFNTMYGAFREEQIDIFNPNLAAVHDKQFEEQWIKSNETGSVFQSYDFEVPSEVEQLLGLKLSPSQLIELLKEFINTLYDIKF